MANNFDRFMPDYQVGTLTLIEGQTAFTAADALLTFAAIREGDFIIAPTGLIARIAAISDDSHGELIEPCPAGLAGTYRTCIRFQSDNSRYTGQQAALIKLLSGGNLSALARLVGEPDALIGFTGSGTLGVVPKDDLVVPDDNGTLAALAAIELAANKALVTDANNDVQQIELGTLGRALLALATGTTAQYVQGDGTLQAKASLPISTPVQTALNAKANLSGSAFTGSVSVAGNLSTQGTLSMRTNNETSSTVLFWMNNYLGSSAWTMSLTATPLESLAFAAFENGAWLRNTLTLSKSGAVAVNGSLSKGSGTFLIDHPKDPFNKNLRHGFVESTEYVNIYRGIVDLIDGRMTVDIDAAFGMTDGTFAALNADVMVSSLQNQYGPDRVWVEAVPDSGKFTIICENTQSAATIAWMVTGRRNDAFVRSALDPNTDSEGRFIPEFDKEDA